MAERRSTARSLLLFALLMAAARLYTVPEPLEMDAATYAVVAAQMRDGKSLYSDLWDHKPPAIYATFALAQMAAGDGPAHVYVLGLLAAIATMLGVSAAAAFWAVTSADLYLQANQPNTEAFLNACLIWVFALLLRRDGGRAMQTTLLIGALLALATLYKQVAIAVGLALALAHVAAPPPGTTRRGALLQPLAWAGVGAVVWGTVIAYFAASGRAVDFWAASSPSTGSTPAVPSRTCWPA